jgi:hypothetical protein
MNNYNRFTNNFKYKKLINIIYVSIINIHLNIYTNTYLIKICNEAGLGPLLQKKKYVTKN